MFNPSVNQTTIINETQYLFTAHPAISGSLSIPYGQEGRRAVVYQLKNEYGQFFALKIFKPAYRTPRVLTISKTLRQYADLSGMAVANRIVITKDNNFNLTVQYPDLQFAILMPWVDGFTCFDIFANNPPMSFVQILNYSVELSNVLSTLESQGLAHTDISSSNVIINLEKSQVYLVGIENFFGENFEKPERLSAGTSGYAHPIAKLGLWSKSSDRFSGAVLISELLGQTYKNIKNYTFGESYFSQDEIGKPSERLDFLCSILGSINHSLAELLKEAWFSKTLDECPPLKDWYSVLSSLQQQKSG